ncbi:MAG TPA: DNA/RNA nuclease SfsA [Desulfuromonadales bacterium]|nr:DNA/RNA nuclease SfsA [Desulfuromonadales bacterium]
MQLPSPLMPGRLLRRYKRFLADVELDDGQVVTAHTPNTGSMRQCAVPGHEVLLSASDNPRRKLAWSWELVRVNGGWTDINTHRANRVVEEGLRQGLIEGLAGYQIIPEYRFGQSRLDFSLEKGHEQVLVEVKNVTLCCEPKVACFPDAVTVRGQKHLRELAGAVRPGRRAVIFFVVQRHAAEAFAPADDIDREYGHLLRWAAGRGVEVLAYRTTVTPREVRLDKALVLHL